MTVFVRDQFQSRPPPSGQLADGFGLRSFIRSPRSFIRSPSLGDYPGLDTSGKPFQGWKRQVGVLLIGGVVFLMQGHSDASTALAKGLYDNLDTELSSMETRQPKSRAVFGPAPNVEVLFPFLNLPDVNHMNVDGQARNHATWPQYGEQVFISRFIGKEVANGEWRVSQVVTNAIAQGLSRRSTRILPSDGKCPLSDSASGCFYELNVDVLLENESALLSGKIDDLDGSDERQDDGGSTEKRGENRQPKGIAGDLMIGAFGTGASRSGDGDGDGSGDDSYYWLVFRYVFFGALFFGGGLLLWGLRQ